MKRYTVGIKKDDNSYYPESSVDLLYFITTDKILKQIEFLNNFEI